MAFTLHSAQKNWGEPKKWENLQKKKMASCSYLCRLLSYRHRKSKITMYISDLRTTQTSTTLGISAYQLWQIPIECQDERFGFGAQHWSLASKEACLVQTSKGSHQNCEWE